MNNADNNELFLLKKGKRGAIKMIFGRTGIIILLLVLQIWLLVCLVRFFEGLVPYLWSGSLFISLVMVVHLVNTEHNASVKITWIILIMILPVFGALLYICIQLDIGHRALKQRMEIISAAAKNELPVDGALLEKLREDKRGLYNLTIYTLHNGGYPIYQNTQAWYFAQGEDKFAEMLRQIEQAEHFIFLEYFIVREGHMWGRVLSLLAKKVKQGVEVRMMYDGTCAFSSLPYNYPKSLEQLGIQCKMFSPLRPFLSTHYNYRDHRKILVIDGHTAFTGGINLADEYINLIQRHGHWKDTAIMIKGEAVRSFTLMFLQLWNTTELQINYQPYLSAPIPITQPGGGYILPYGDSPLDEDKVGQMVYMDMLNRAERYVHIMTPYLILDGEMTTALQFAAKRGVEVKLIMPYIADHWYADLVAKTHYKELLKAGVKIYEYTPGFIHAKVFVSDDCKAVVGTINLDYRSLYHHFECAAYMEDMPVIADIEADVQNTLAKCRQISMQDVKNQRLGSKIAGRVLRLIAPLI